MAIKRAKLIETEQFDRLLIQVQYSDHPLRDEAALYLSYRVGLRAHEIANLRWKNNILTMAGRVDDVLHITSDVGKRSVERSIPLMPAAKEALERLRLARPDDVYVFYAIHNNVRAKCKGKVNPVGKVTPSAVAKWFERLYADAGYEGCSSHSGRRSFITFGARLASSVGCSIRDVQLLAGHRSLVTTADYIEPSAHQHRLVASW